MIFQRFFFNYLYELSKHQIHRKQFGFQSRKNAVLQLFDYLETLHSNTSHTLFTIYLDYEKAFDKIPHEILIAKLKLFGFDEELCTLFVSYLENRSQIVNVDDYFSDPILVTSGVPQGSVLGAFLFLIFINDLPSIFTACLAWMFADDLNLIFTSLNFYNGLLRLYNWNIANGMSANLDKTKCLNLKGSSSVEMNRHLLDNVAHIKDLGIIVSYNLK